MNISISIAYPNRNRQLKTRKMTCSIQCGKQCQLSFTFPEGGYKKNFKLILCPDEGKQRSIIRCKWTDSYKCDTKDGFRIEFPSDNQALITLPKGFNDTPGSLKCQIAGQQVTSPVGCSWKMRGNHMVDNIVEPQGGPNITQMPHEPFLPRSEDSGDGGPNLQLIVGCVIGAALIVLSILLFIFLLRRYKQKLSPCCPEKPNKNESLVSGPESDEKICMLGLVNDIMVETEQIFPKKITRKETDVNDIDEKKPFLWNEQESNEKNACNKGSEKKSSDGESDNTKNDEGFEEKGSDEKKSSDKESDKTKNDEGFEEKGSDEEKSSDCDTDENNSDEGFEEKSGSSKLGGEKHG